jgi:choline dehydrogenase-like flavoprotein
VSDNQNNTPFQNAKFDYIIIGQGLCGTFLSWYLLTAGKKVLVIDESKPFTATKVASGVINPVTGRRIVRTWRIEELYPFALEAFTTFGIELSAELMQEVGLLDFHSTLQMKEAFEKRLLEGEEYLHIPSDGDKWKVYFNYYFSVGAVKPCLLIDLNTMLIKWRQRLIELMCLLDEQYNWNYCKVFQDHIEYKNVTAKKYI